MNARNEHNSNSAHLPSELVQLAAEIEQSRAALPSQALERMLAQTTPLIAAKVASEVSQPALRVVGDGDLVVARRVSARVEAMTSSSFAGFRLAAAIALFASLGAALVASRTSSTQTPMQGAIARAQQLSRDTAIASANAQTVKAPSGNTEGEDDLALWEGWLASADVHSSDWSMDDVNSDESSDGEASDGQEQSEDELDWLDLGIGTLRESRDGGIQDDARLEAR